MPGHRLLWPLMGRDHGNSASKTVPDTLRQDRADRTISTYHVIQDILLAEVETVGRLDWKTWGPPAI